MTPHTRRTLTAAAVAAGVCAAIGVGSALSTPTLITGGPLSDGSATPPAAQPPAPSVSAVPPVASALPLPDSSGIDLEPLLTAVATVAVVALAIVIAFALVRAVRALANRAKPEPIDTVVEAADVAPDEVRRILQRARQEIDVDDADRAVVRCWEALESLGAQAGVARGASETSSDYVVGILTAFSLPSAPARRLSRLYDRALFSAERLGPDDARRARADLSALDAALAGRPTVSATAESPR